MFIILYMLDHHNCIKKLPPTPRMKFIIKRNSSIAQDARAEGPSLHQAPGTQGLPWRHGPISE